MEIEDLVGMLGLNLPRVIGINVATEWVKHELERLDAWKPVRKVGFVIPLAIAVWLCWMAGERGAGAMRCGVMYGLAAIALHEFDHRILQERR